MRKILITFCRYGSGHKSIAEYVYNYIKENNPNDQVMLFDMTDYSNRFGRIGIKLFDFVTKHKTGKIFDLCYEVMDHKMMTFSHNKIAQKSYDNSKLRREIGNFNPDIVISSHFYCSDILNYYNKLKLINTKIFTIITDYKSHECWISNHKEENGFIVANDIVKEELIKSGVDGKKIYPFGLPLNIDKINNLACKKDILKKYKISNKKKIILFFGGSSSGNMVYFDYLKYLLKSNIDAYIVFVSGKNEKLKNKCQEFVNANNYKDVLITGYTNDALSLIKISDLVITKPGGATVTECLELKTPMILVPGVGGQEKYNAKFLQKKKYGIKVNTFWGFKRIIKNIKVNDKIIMKLQRNMLEIKNSNAVQKINDLVNMEVQDE